jgi:hypothetical protein
MFIIKKFKPKMDSYDEVHDVKNGHDIATPPESLENIEKGTTSGASAIKFTEEDEGENKEKQALTKVPSLEVRKICKILIKLIFVIIF